MSGLSEIQQAILDLPTQERAQLWDWFQSQEVEESPELLAAVDEGIRSIESRKTVEILRFWHGARDPQNLKLP